MRSCQLTDAKTDWLFFSAVEGLLSMGPTTSSFNWRSRLFGDKMFPTDWLNSNRWLLHPIAGSPGHEGDWSGEGHLPQQVGLWLVRRGAPSTPGGHRAGSGSLDRLTKASVGTVHPARGQAPTVGLESLMKTTCLKVPILKYADAKTDCFFFVLFFAEIVWWSRLKKIHLWSEISTVIVIMIV